MPNSSDVPRCAQCRWSTPVRALRSRKTTRSSPRMRTRRGGPSRSRANATGCQNRLRYSPPGVPGPAGVSSGSGAGVSRRTYPSYGLPDARAGDIGGAQHGARSTPRQVASRLPGRSRIHAESARRANLPWWVATYPARGLWWLCQPKNININIMLRVAWALLSMRFMFTTQGTSTRSVLTGIAILLTGCLALAGAAQAEVETTPIAMAVDPATFQGEGPILASWSADSSRYAARYSEATWTETFGQPAEAPTATVQTASFTPAPTLERSVVILPAAKPLAAYRVHVNEHVRFFLDRFQTGYRRAGAEGWLTRSGRYLPMILEVFRQKGLPEDLVFTVMIESGFNPVAVSQAGAKGLWQFMAPTARLYGLRVDGWLGERLDPENSTVAAANYLRDLYAQFGSWDLAQAAYNTGDGKIQQVIDRTGSRAFLGRRKRPRLLR